MKLFVGLAWRQGTIMQQKRLGQALFEIGCHAAGWTAAIMFLCGGGSLVFSTASTFVEKPLVQVFAWAQIVVLGAGLVLMAVGHLLRQVAGDPSAPELVDRVTALEQEVALLRAGAESAGASGQSEASRSGSTPSKNST